MRRLFGPSTLITAAFIGPGTVTVCTLAGVQAGYVLLWALLFSVLATIFLQEMTGRLGLITQQGFGEAIRRVLVGPQLRVIVITLVLAAIVIGNAAYQGGNISGAALGVEALPGLGSVTSVGPVRLLPLLIGGFALAVLWSGQFRIIARSLLVLVAIMSVVFVGTAILVNPDWSTVIAGMLLPRAEAQDWLLVIALIGTTVVPYNLFLHAALIRERFNRVEELGALRLEIVIAIGLGGLISMSIVITSAATLFGQPGISSAADMAMQLQPLLGRWSSLFLGVGLFAAGISSAITAPLAAAFAARGVLGWDAEKEHWKYRLVWLTILLFGVLVASSGWSPVLVIQFAQVANGILLPLVVAVLLMIMNSRAILGAHTNSPGQNLAGFVILAITILIGIRSLNNVFAFL